MAENTNDNEPRRVPHEAHGPDAHGQAAFLLIESMLHGLIARSVISVEDAIEIVGIAAEVKADVAQELGDTPETLRKSMTLLEAISTSLSLDR